MVIEKAVLRSETADGVLLFVLVPSPNCPLVLAPQHLTVESDSKAQECKEPIEIAVASDIQYRSTR